MLTATIDSRPFRASLAVGGVDGTLRRRLGRAAAVVVGKTGTLDRAVALSGRIEVDDRPVLIFSIVSNGLRRHKHRAVRAATDRLVEALARIAAGRGELDR